MHLPWEISTVKSKGRKTACSTFSGCENELSINFNFRCHLEPFSHVVILFVILMKLDIFSFENIIDKLASSEVIADHE